jgi:hypothetical protein
MQDKSVGLFGLQETNRNFGNRSVSASFHETIKRASSHYRGSVSSAKLQWPTDYQPGGTAVAARNEWATRFLSQGSDNLGRWSWITLAGQNKLKITFLSGYIRNYKSPFRHGIPQNFHKFNKISMYFTF